MGNEYLDQLAKQYPRYIELRSYDFDLTQLQELSRIIKDVSESAKQEFLKEHEEDYENIKKYLDAVNFEEDRVLDSLKEEIESKERKTTYLRLLPWIKEIWLLLRLIDNKASQPVGLEFKKLLDADLYSCEPIIGFTTMSSDRTFSTFLTQDVLDPKTLMNEEIVSINFRVKYPAIKGEIYIDIDTQNPNIQNRDINTIRIIGEDEAWVDSIAKKCKHILSRAKNKRAVLHSVMYDNIFSSSLIQFISAFLVFTAVSSVLSLTNVSNVAYEGFIEFLLNEPSIAELNFVIGIMAFIFLVIMLGVFFVSFRLPKYVRILWPLIEISTGFVTSIQKKRKYIWGFFSLILLPIIIELLF